MSGATPVFLLVLATALAPHLPPGEPEAPPPPFDFTLAATQVPEGTVTIDARLDESVWRDAEVASSFVQAEPRPGDEAGERTEVRVLFSERALYVAARLRTDDPARVHAPLARRNEDVASDWFYVLLDPNGDRTTAVAFGINPRGVRRDFRISEDGVEDPEWTARWEGAARIDDEGWTVELRIPFTQLRFGAGDAGVGRAWGVNFRRHDSRAGEVSSWAPTPRNRRELVPSFGTLSGLESVRSPIRAELVPYSTARATRTSGGADGEAPFFGTVGLDARVGVTPNLTLTATLNPDFGQVEADPAVVNVSGFRTFFPEKRPFFLEDEDLFGHMIGQTRIFHSRRIGRDTRPSPHTRSEFDHVPDASGILAATKLSGRTDGGWSIGVLHALGNAELRVSVDSVGVETLDPVEPRTHYGVARVTRSYREGNEALGGILTATRRGLDPGLEHLPANATVGGLTWYRRAGSGDYELAASLLGSRVEGAPSALAQIQTAHGRYLQRPGASHVRYDSTRTVLTGLAGDLSLSGPGGGDWVWGAGGRFVSPGFEANDLGHQREADVAHQFVFGGYDRLEQGLLLRRRRAVVTQWSDWSFGRERVGTGASADVRLQFVNFWGLIFQGERHLPALSTDQLRGGPALRMPGSTRTRVIFHLDPRRAVNLRLDGSRTVEEETDAELRVFRVVLDGRPLPWARLSLEPSMVDRLDRVEYITQRTHEEGTRYLFARMDMRTLSLVTRVDLAFSPDLSLQFYAQPYLVTRTAAHFMEVADPSARRFADRFRPFGEDQVRYDLEGERYHVDVDGDGSDDLSFPDPGFTYGQLSSNLVLRWEYRPGSTLYFAWSRDAFDRRGAGSLYPLDGVSDLVGFGLGPRVPATNTLLLKLSFLVGS